MHSPSEGSQESNESEKDQDIGPKSITTKLRKSVDEQILEQGNNGEK